MKKTKNRDMVKIDRDEALALLDLVDESIRWSSVSMMDLDRYGASSNAMWALVNMIAGKQDVAKDLSKKAKKHYAVYCKKHEKKAKKS